MSFRVDSRARVPFAVLGALLLLSSTLYATTATPGAIREPVSPLLVDQAQTEARMAIGTAVRNAGHQAARRPVVEPSTEGMGSILDDESTFRSYLRLLVALHVREELADVAAERDGVTATVGLPPIDSQADVERAIEGVTITPVSGDRYRVHVSGLQVEIERHGRQSDVFDYETNLTVPIPALVVHDRVETFESRLHNGMTEPGFERGLTSRLFGVTWARGYAQYGGAPIDNVLGNRHVEVLANDALIAQQAAVFGRADEDARRATNRAASNVLVRDGLLIAEGAIKDSVQERVESDTNGSQPSLTGGYSMPSAYDSERSYHVNRTADESFVDFVETGSKLDDVLDRVYRAEVKADAHTSYRGTRTSRSGSIPSNASLFATHTDTRRWLEDGSWTRRSGDTLRTFHGTVVVERTTTRLWVSNNSLDTTSYTRQSTHYVSVDLRCRYTGGGIAPDRPEPTCPFGAEARSRLDRRALDEVVRGAGGIESIAVDAVRGDGGSGWETVDIDPPNAVRRAVYDRTASFRERVRSVSVSVRPRSIASSANPASLLAEELHERQWELVNPPSRYRSASDRAAVAARLEYLRSVRSDLQSQSPMIHRAQQELVSTLDGRSIPLAPPRDETSRMSAIASSVTGRPVYLSVQPEAGSPPMAARNVNVFAVPYGDTADHLTDTLFDGSAEDTSLGTAAKTLKTMETASRSSPDRTVRSDRDRLRSEIERALATARNDYRSVVAEETDERTASEAVPAAFDRWDRTHERALAITEGRMAGAIVDATVARNPGTNEDLLQVRLRVASSEIREDTNVRVEESVVNGARESVQTATNQALSDSLKTGATEAADAVRKRGSMGATTGLPAGIPLLPVPGYWYATANAWVVQVRGSYERFTVRTPRASPVGNPNGTVDYVRNRSSVAIDVDGDGQPEHLGRNKPVTFEANTGVVIVVPPGGTGVGDVDGNVDERSPGFSVRDG